MSWKERAKKVKEQEDDYSISSTEAPPVSSGWRERAKPVKVSSEPEYPVLDATQEGLKMLGGAIDTVDSYTGAPVRAGLGALQRGESPLPAAYEQFGEPTSKAPTMAKLAGNMGVSEEEYDTPIILNPFTREKLKVSPAGVVGGIAGMAIDPTTYMGPGVAKGIKSAGEFAAERLGPSMARFAEERAVKAGTGHSKRALKEIAKTPDKARDAEKMLENIGQAGRALLEPDAAGPPAVGWFSKNSDVGAASEAKRKFFGKKFEEAAPVIDRLVPEGIAPQIIGSDVAEIGRKTPNVGKNVSAKKQLAEESGRISEYTPPESGYPEGALGPAAPLKYGDAQFLKNQYDFTPQAPDLVTSNKDASNAINRAIGKRMDEMSSRAAERAVSEEDVAAIKARDAAKVPYGIYDKIGRAGAEQVAGEISRRIISPSSYGVGAGAGATAGIGAAAASGQLSSVLAGIPVALIVSYGNQLALERGPAFTARLANSVSKRLINGPRTYQKWMRPFQAAAKMGTPAVVGLHQQLMNNDPEYREMMAPVSEEP